MKSKHIFYLLITLFFTISSCDKTPQNGELDGSWQLVKMTAIDTMQQSKHLQKTRNLEIVDNGSPMTNYGIYWNFQLDLLMIYTPWINHNGHTPYTIARFHAQNEKLTILDTYIHYDNRDSLLTPQTNCLSNVGIPTNREEFQMNIKDGNKMSLRSKHYQLEFRKY